MSRPATPDKHASDIPSLESANVQPRAGGAARQRRHDLPSAGTPGRAAAPLAPDYVIAYYDDPVNAQAMCTLLMGAHPGWTVWRLGTKHTFRSVPLWFARRDEWPASQPPLSNENAGLLNLAMYLTDAGAQL
ncbi:hypothetical protein [Nonomuraea basaltis]|uniref:hypothetical protein n=1 Tax=Nonomuraea basaltis TaxID=2495887 RepID=UPI00110C6C6D|nr:hypothetical protein [Nonomuraea basaltis]TMR90369.1 hypothetical protein EJK15_55690 [Nonomuraea basaltis]